MGETGNNNVGYYLVAKKDSWQLVRCSEKVELQHIHPERTFHEGIVQLVNRKTGMCMLCNREAPAALQAMLLVT